MPATPFAARPTDPPAHRLLASVLGWLVRQANARPPPPGLTADDVLGEFVARVLAHAHEYDPAKGRPTTWATLQVHNVRARLWLARGRRPPEVQSGDPRDPDDVESGPLALVVSREADPLDAAVRADLAARATAAVAALPDGERRAVAGAFGLGGAARRRRSERLVDAGLRTVRARLADAG